MKKTDKIIIALVVWFVSTMGIITLSLNLISESNTGLNILGLGILILWVLISKNTSCLTNISIKYNKDKK